MVHKIQRWQVAGFVRMLERRLEEMKEEDVSRYYDNPRRDAEKARLEKEYHLKQIEQEKDAAYDRWLEADKKIREELERFEQEAKLAKRAKMQDIRRAIQDLWVAETVEEAKRIAKPFLMEA